MDGESSRTTPFAIRLLMLQRRPINILQASRRVEANQGHISEIGYSLN